MFCKLTIPQQNSRNREQIEFMSSGENIKSIDIKAYITFLKWKIIKKVTYLGLLIPSRKSKSEFLFFPQSFLNSRFSNLRNEDS